MLFPDTDSLRYEIETKDFYEDFIKIKKALIWAIILLSQNIMVLWVKLIASKMKDETSGVTIK